MEIKSVIDCLKFIDSMTLGFTKKHDGIGILEDVRDYIIWMYNDSYIEEKVNVWAILSQVTLIREKIYLTNECAYNPLNHELRRRI